MEIIAMNDFNHRLPRYQQMYRDLLAQGARRVVVPRYVQQPEGTRLAEAAVVPRWLLVGSGARGTSAGERTRRVNYSP